jgi:RHS repeat-associated protein
VTGASFDGYSRLTEVEAYGPADTSAAGGVQWLVADHLGTPRMILDQSGDLEKMKRHDYLPFGEELFAPTGGRTTAMGYSGGDGVRQQFTLKERDIETGLDYFLARNYSSTQGRFVNADAPFADQSARDPQSWNLYTYVRNNPLRFIDPDGRKMDGDILEKLKNYLAGYGYQTDAEVRAETERRRCEILHLTSQTPWPSLLQLIDPRTGTQIFRSVYGLSQSEVWEYSEMIRRGQIRVNYIEVPEVSVPVGTTRGASGKVSTEKYLENNWDKATFGSVKKSIRYHVDKHGKGMSDVEYTQRAVKAFNDSSAVRSKTVDRLGREAVQVTAKEGTGLFTKAGKIIWFHPK